MVFELKNDENMVVFSVNTEGELYAKSKSFLIKHPTKQNHSLRYGSLEGPEHGVYVRGNLINNNTIELPEHWTNLVNEESISVQLTSIGSHQNLYVKSISDNKIVIGNGNLLNSKINCYYLIFGERKDVDKIIVESEIPKR